MKRWDGLPMVTMDGRATAKATEHAAPPARARILNCAVREFLDKGFAEASLRSIAAAASVTTGAIYGHFSSKEALFDALVGPAGNELYRRYATMQEQFYTLPEDRQTLQGMQGFEQVLIHDMLDYVYDHQDEFVLILTKAAGTAWEGYLDRFVELERESTHRYVRMMRARGKTIADIEPATARILASMFFRGYFEPLVGGMKRDEAHAFIASLERFFHAGYVELIATRELG
ncbi:MULTISPECIES: TetR/AcrR family transcriptional regulator [Paraeggerthella]|uniref:TetR/AcrR family transcriptional regulator n=1 Tax=Paraeggerthella TaxID=651554 RepID=UPI00272E59B7|nr:TetR/AcrR family transcriptional regulator [Paraeggerthella sp. Marseille-Q4926]MDY3981966.1 helix-turn-helix domain-containing protein [Paraeggerthella sp.]